MRRSWLVIACLAVVVGALGWLAASRQKESAETSVRISAADATAATRIEIERGTLPRMVIEKVDGVWRVTAPLNGRADMLRVDKLLALINARAPTRFPATDLARFELDAPVARVRIDHTLFEFGGIHAATREQSVRQGDYVYPLNLSYGAMLPQAPADLLDRRLLAASEVPIRIALLDITIGGLPHNPLKREDKLPSADDTNRWLDEWRHAPAVRVMPAAATGRAPQALSEGEILLKSGNRIVLHVLQRAPEFIIVRADEGLQYHYPAPAAARLLQPPASAQQNK